MEHGHPTSRLMVLLFTDVVGSVELKAKLGTAVFAQMLEQHDEILREIIATTPNATIIKDLGDGFMISFTTASHAVNAALRFQYRLALELWKPRPLLVRVGLHLGEVTEQAEKGSTGQTKIVGMAADIAARMVGMASGGQILMTRAAFDDARQFVREHPPVPGQGQPPRIQWLTHGHYVFKGTEDPIEVFEVGAVGLAPLTAPPDNEKAKRAVLVGQEGSLGWRPAVELEVPHRANWVLERKLGEGGFGEVWMARHTETKDRRVFKFCFDVTRRRTFKREVEVMRLIREKLGDRPDIARLNDVQLDEPPFFLEMEFSEHGSLLDWSRAIQGLEHVPLATRIDIVARTADALAAAHSVGILHQDIKPSNILIYLTDDGWPRPRLSDFGIGVVTDLSRTAMMPSAGISLATETIFSMEHSFRGAHLYLPPEVVVGDTFTERGDVYSLGVLLYQMVVADLGRPMGAGWDRFVSDPLLREDIAACVDIEPSRRLAGPALLAERLRRIDSRRQLLEFTIDTQRETERRAQAEVARMERTKKRMQVITVVAVAALAILIVQGVTGIVFRGRWGWAPGVPGPTDLKGDPHIAEGPLDRQNPAEHRNDPPPVKPVETVPDNPKPVAVVASGNTPPVPTTEPVNVTTNSAPPNLAPVSIAVVAPPPTVAVVAPEGVSDDVVNEKVRPVLAAISQRNVREARIGVDKLRTFLAGTTTLASLDAAVAELEKEQERVTALLNDAIENRDLVLAQNVLATLRSAFPAHEKTTSLRAAVKAMETDVEKMLAPIQRAISDHQPRLAQLSLDALKAKYPRYPTLERLQGEVTQMGAEEQMAAEVVDAAISANDARNAKLAMQRLRERFPKYDRLSDLASRVDALEGRVVALIDPVRAAVEARDSSQAVPALEALQKAFPNDDRVGSMQTRVNALVADTRAAVKSVEDGVASGDFRQAQIALDTLRFRFPTSPELGDLEKSVLGMLDAAAVKAAYDSIAAGDHRRITAAVANLRKATGSDTSALYEVSLSVLRDNARVIGLPIIGLKSVELETRPSPAEISLAREITLTTLEDLASMSASGEAIDYFRRLQREVWVRRPVDAGYSLAWVVSPSDTANTQAPLLAFGFGPARGGVTVVDSDRGVRRWTVNCDPLAAPTTQPAVGARIVIPGQGKWTSAAVAPRGRRIAAADAKNVWLIDVSDSPEKPSQVTVAKNEPGDYAELAFCDSGTRLLGWKLDGSVKVWDANSGEVIRTITRSHDSLAVASITSDGRRVVTVGGDGAVKIWDTVPPSDMTGEKGRLFREGRTIRKSGTLIEAAAWNHDGTLLACGSIDGTLSLYDAVANAWIAAPEQRLSQRIGHTYFRRDGRLFWSSSVLDGFLKSWQPATDASSASPDSGEHAVWSILGQVGRFSISHDGQWLITLGRDRQSVVVFRASTLPSTAAR